MDYTSLVASKGTAGSILNWVGYSKIDAPTLLDEAQGLIYQFLRVREMRKEWIFAASVGQSSVDLPQRFLDPIGEVYDATNNTHYAHLIEGSIQRRRTYESDGGTVSLGASPFTTVSGSALVTVHKTAHGINQDSIVTVAGAVAVNGITPNGSFEVASVTGVDDFVIDTGDTNASASGAGGGSGASYVANNLISGTPSCWTIFGEDLKFDVAFDTAATMKLLYYRQPLPLSATNLTNFLTVRYPKLVRVATLAAAAEFMKDDAEYQKQLGAVQALIQTTAAGDDFTYRGASFGTENP